MPPAAVVPPAVVPPADDIPDEEPIPEVVPAPGVEPMPLVVPEPELVPPADVPPADDIPVESLDVEPAPEVEPVVPAEVSVVDVESPEAPLPPPGVELPAADDVPLAESVAVESLPEPLPQPIMRAARAASALNWNVRFMVSWSRPSGRYGWEEVRPQSVRPTLRDFGNDYDRKLATLRAQGASLPEMERRTMAIMGIMGMGFTLGLLAPFARYAYGDTNGVPYRFDRLTGVQQYPSSSGWVTDDDLSKKVEERLAPEIARFGERVAQMREAQRSGALRKIDVTGRQVSAYYTDGRKEEYYALDTADPRLDDVQRIADRLTPAVSGGTAGGTGE